MRRLLFGVLVCALLVVGLIIGTAPVLARPASTPAPPDRTIGQTGGTGGCYAGASPGAVVADTNYAVPTGGGTITSFSFQSTSANHNQQLDFLVLQHVSGTSYTVVGKTSLETLQGTGTETFSPSNAISVHGGEIIGFWIPSTETLANCLRVVASGGGWAGASGQGDPALDATVDVPPLQTTLDLNESATLVPPTLTVNPTSLQAGSPVTVSWSGVPAPTSHDWIGVYHPGDPNNTPLGGFYDDSCTTTAGSTALASGSCLFVVPKLSNIAGTYVLRLFSNNSLTLLATSDAVTVGAGKGSAAHVEHDARLLPLRGRGGGSLRPASRGSRPFPLRSADW